MEWYGIVLEKILEDLPVFSCRCSASVFSGHGICGAPFIPSRWYWFPANLVYSELFRGSALAGISNYLISELDMTCKAPRSVVECTHLPP